MVSLIGFIEDARAGSKPLSADCDAAVAALLLCRLRMNHPELPVTAYCDQALDRLSEDVQTGQRRPRHYESVLPEIALIRFLIPLRIRR